MQTYKTKFIQITLWLALVTTFVGGQKQPKRKDFIKAETSAVIMAASIRELTARETMTNLQPEDSTLSAGSNSPNLSESAFDDEIGCPLTLIMHLNFVPNGALKYLELPKSKKSRRRNVETPANGHRYLSTVDRRVNV